MTGPTLDAPKVHSLGRWSIVLVLVMVGVSGSGVVLNKPVGIEALREHVRRLLENR